MIKEIAETIRQADSVLLTTHRQCDGDGLGAELAMYHALKKIGKQVRVLNVDGTPKKYNYLEPDKHIQYFDGDFSPIGKPELALVFDTNDRRLVDPLYGALESSCQKIIFVDHHPVLKDGPKPTEGSIINVRAASTGELAFDIIRELEIPLDANIARAIYTSIVFDTQLFRYVRNSPRSHAIAVELFEHEKNPTEVHRFLFGNFTASKLRFMARALTGVEFHEQDKLAMLHLTTEEIHSYGLDIDDSRDLIDMIMNVDTVQAAAFLREDQPGSYKLSLRSKGLFPVLDIAESFGGGGHLFASGARVEGEVSELKAKLVLSMKQAMNKKL